MDMLQIYVGFSLKTTIHVQYFNIYGHITGTCSFYAEIWLQIKDRIRQKVKSRIDCLN